jgi:hypothetical protein
MDVIETITKPWRDPIDYVTLAFWVAFFLVVAFALLDATRILTTWVVKQAK